MVDFAVIRPTVRDTRTQR